MSANPHVQMIQIDQYNSLNLEAVQDPEEIGGGEEVRSAVHDPVFRFVIAGFVSMFALLGIAVALTF